MKIRLFDRFDREFTCGIYKDVYDIGVEGNHNGYIVFEDGEETSFDSEFVDYEYIA